MARLSRILGGSRGRVIATAAAAFLALGGIAAVVIAFSSQTSPPMPAADTPPPTAGTAAPPAPPTSTSEQTAPSTSKASTPTLPAAPPTAIAIPAIGVESTVMTVGKNPDGTMEVPQPGANYDKAAWYRFSPTPGELGPSVIIGHIDSAESGPSVFYDLGAMQPGQQISVTRDDGTVAVFTVDRVERYPKEDFPTLEVYGNTDTAQLRLITCGGVFDSGTNNYLDNIVVYAHLTGSHQ